MTVAGNNLSISNGNTVALPQSLDNDSTNEIQTLSLNGNNLTISNGNTVSLPNPSTTLSSAFNDTITFPTLGPFQFSWSASNSGTEQTLSTWTDTLTITRGLVFFRIQYFDNYTNTGTNVSKIGAYFSLEYLNGQKVQMRLNQFPQNGFHSSTISKELFLGREGTSLKNQMYGSAYLNSDTVVLKMKIAATGYNTTSIGNFYINQLGSGTLALTNF